MSESIFKDSGRLTGGQKELLGRVMEAREAAMIHWKGRANGQNYIFTPSFRNGLIDGNVYFPRDGRRAPNSDFDPRDVGGAEGIDQVLEAAGRRVGRRSSLETPELDRTDIGGMPVLASSEVPEDGPGAPNVPAGAGGKRGIV